MSSLHRIDDVVHIATPKQSRGFTVRLRLKFFVLQKKLNKMSSINEDLKDERVPGCLQWSCDDVADWIEGLGYPYYKVRHGLIKLTQ